MKAAWTRTSGPGTRGTATIAVLLAVVALVLAARQPGDRAAVRQAILAAEDARAPKAEDVQLLIRAGGSADEATAAAAVRALGRLERASLLDDLVRFVDVASPAVRSEAANAIGQSVASGDAPVERARAILTARLASEKDAGVRGVLCETLGRLPYTTEEAVRAVEARLVDESQPSGRTITTRQETTTTTLGTPVSGVTIGISRGPHDAPPLVLLGAMKGLEALIRQAAKVATPSPPTLARLRRLVTSPSSSSRIPAADREAVTRARRLALQALVTAGGADEPTIVAAQGDADPQIRRLAMLAAASAPDLAHRDSLIARGLEDREPMVRLEAVRAYGRALQAQSGCGPIVRAIGDADLHVALAAIDQLGAGCADGTAAIKALDSRVALLTPQNLDAWHAPAHALVSLARSSRERASAALPAFVTHPVWQVRMYAARAAAALEDAMALGRLAADAQPNVCEAAIAGLTKLKGHGADSIYLAALESQDYQLVRTAALALKGSPTREGAAQALLKTLARLTADRRDTSRDPRLAILETLRDLGPATGAATLEPYLRDFDPRVAAEAASIVSAWTGQRRDPITAAFAPVPPPRWSDVAALDGARVRVFMRQGGPFEMILFPLEAPATVDRFVRLARRGYYDGLTFHRVVPNFVIQGGSPGANEYVGDGPYMRDEVGLRPHRRGAVGISTRGRDTGDAQIFIDLVDNPRLDHEYTVFAEVVKGMDVVDRVREGDVIDRVEVVPAR